MLFFPADVFTAIECGVDVFDSACVYAATERGCGLTYPNFSSPLDNSDVTSTATSEHTTTSEIDLNDNKYD